jgi:hypothetical protein
MKSAPKLLSRLIPLLLCALAVPGLGAEHSDYAIALGNGYELVRANSHETFVSNREQRVVVPGKVIQYAVVGDLVVGQVKMPDWDDKGANEMFADVVEGYFLLDTKLQTHSLGLTMPCLRDKLLQRGIKKLPPLHEPRRVVQ